jgi:hypothetical protein
MTTSSTNSGFSAVLANGVRKTAASAHLALAAVLEGDLGLDAARRIAGIERLHQRLVSLGNDPPAHLARAGQFAVIGIELLVQDQEPADLRRRQGRLGREVVVDALDAALH